MWRDLPFQSFKPHKKATTKIEHCKKSYEIYEMIHVRKFPKTPKLSFLLCCVTIVGYCVSAREERGQSSDMDFTPFLCPSLTNSPLFTAQKPQLWCLWIKHLVYILPSFSLSNIPYSSLFALALFLMEKSISILWLVGSKQSPALHANKCSTVKFY